MWGDSWVMMRCCSRLVVTQIKGVLAALRVRLCEAYALSSAASQRAVWRNFDIREGR